MHSAWAVSIDRNREVIFCFLIKIQCHFQKNSSTYCYYYLKMHVKYTCGVKNAHFEVTERSYEDRPPRDENSILM